MNGGEKKLGANWDLVTRHYGVRLANHASYCDWVDSPFLLQFSFAPIFFHCGFPLLFRLLGRQDFLHSSAISTHKFESWTKFESHLLHLGEKDIFPKRSSNFPYTVFPSFITIDL
jgi:hypothetical protein